MIERFYDRFHDTGFTIPDHPTYTGRVVWNRIRSAEVDPKGRKSRVLLISGPSALVNEFALRSYFSGKIQFQVESVQTLNQTTHPANAASSFGEIPAVVAAESQRALIEFRFGSYRCQAESARMALTREFKEYGVFCDFGKLIFSLNLLLDKLLTPRRQGPLRSSDRGGSSSPGTLVICGWICDGLVSLCLIRWRW